MNHDSILSAVVFFHLRGGCAFLSEFTLFLVLSVADANSALIVGVMRTVQVLLLCADHTKNC